MSIDCPTCGRGDAYYEASHNFTCPDPWHTDAHLRRSEIEQLGRPRERAVDKEAVRVSTIQARADHARERFERDLETFVEAWAPGYDDPRARDSFQLMLTMLFRNAMEHKSHTFGLHIERTEMTLDHLSMHATGALRAIYHPPKKDGT